MPALHPAVCMMAKQKPPPVGTDLWVYRLENLICLCGFLNSRRDFFRSNQFSNQFKRGNSNFDAISNYFFIYFIPILAVKWWLWWWWWWFGGCGRWDGKRGYQSKLVNVKFAGFVDYYFLVLLSTLFNMKMRHSKALKL